MRLWTLHPKYLDPQGLVALWREALLARAVLHGLTRGYTRHPQLERFRGHADPRLAICVYLSAVHGESLARGYTFDAAKVGEVRDCLRIRAPAGQVAYEWQHLLAKLASRNPALHERWRGVETPALHPLFEPCAGGIEPWERFEARPKRAGAND